MTSDLSLLRRIQTCDNRIGELSEEIARLPQYVAAIEAKLAAHKRQLAAKQAELEQNRKDRRHLEGEIERDRETVAKLQEQMNSARTNEQFRAFQHEIAFAKDKIASGEDRILDKMMQAEALEENVARAQADLRVEGEKVAAEVAEAKSRVAADERQLAAEKSVRAELAAQLPEPLMRLYARIQKARGTAIAAVVGAQCEACHVILRPQLLQDMKNLNDGALTCETCGRILYFEDEPEDGVALEDPAGEHNLGQA